jgi:hypothetical protein
MTEKLVGFFLTIKKNLGTIFDYKANYRESDKKVW